MIVKQKYHGIQINPNKTQLSSNDSFVRLQSVHQNTYNNLDQANKDKFKVRSRVKTQYIHNKNKSKGLPILNTIDFEHSQGKDYFDPEIYHRPSVRKKYFCQLIDTYIKKEKNSEDKALDSNYPKFRNLYSPNLNMTHFQFTKNGESGQKQNDNKKQSQKRAITAGEGFTRLIQTSYNDNKKYSNEIRKRTLEYEKGGKNYLKIQNKAKVMKTLQARAGRSFGQPEQRIKNESERELARIGKREKKKDNEQNSVSQNLSLSDSDIEKDYSQEKNPFSSQKSKKNGNENSRKDLKNKQKKVRRGLNSNFFESRLFEKEKQKKKLDFIKIEQESKWASLDKIENQIIKRITLMQKQAKPWVLVSVHEHQLYNVYELQVKNTALTNRDKSKTTLTLDEKWKQKNRIKVKRFNEENAGAKLQNTIEKIKESGVSQLWKQLPDSFQKAKQKKSQMKLFFSQNTKNLRQKLFQFIKEEKSNNQSGLSYIIQPTNFYKQLFESNCQNFIDIIISIASDLQAMKGKIINNKLNIDNIYYIEQKNIKIGDWGCAALCRRLQIAGKQVIFKDQPMLKFEQSPEQQVESKEKWLSSPQNLPPEIISCLIEGNYSKIWEIQDCPEVWSLGILIFEILSCVPVWMPYPSTINHKTFKKGCLFDKGKRLEQILDLQKRVPILVSKWIRQNREEKRWKEIDPEIINVMKSSLQISPRSRPKPCEIIKRLRRNG